METTPRTESRSLADPGYQAYKILHIGFTVAPILFGLDKFLNLMVSWDKYLATWMLRIVGKCPPVHVLDRRDIRPRWGAYIVALWLVGIILNLRHVSGLL
jgi:hypothetical protein